MSIPFLFLYVDNFIKTLNTLNEIQEALTKQNEIKFRVFRCFPIEHKAQLLRQAGQLQKQCTVCQKPEFLGLELTNSST